jgi:hypothetical protein
MKQRKKLLRAANILRAVLLTYRDVRYDINLTKIEAKDGMLYLYQNQRIATSHIKWGLFPEHLTSNVQHREAALTINQCTTATALLSCLTRKLLKGESLGIRITYYEAFLTFARCPLDYRGIGYSYRKATTSTEADSRP